MIDQHRLTDLLYFIEQREQARINKERGYAKPWCTDPIVQNYRFCNINRQDDKVTKALQTFYFYNPNMSLETLWFNLVLGRMFNNPDCLMELGYIVQWDADWFKAVLDERQARGDKLFNAAYMIHAKTQGIPKHHYLANDVFTPMWEQIGDAPIHSQYLRTWAIFLSQFYGMGPFMRNQVVADIRYSPYNYQTRTDRANHFRDWSVYVEAGPGTMKGLNYLHNRQQGTTIKDPHAELMELQGILESIPEMPAVFSDPNNVSNTMCEYSKFMRAKLGTGKPKQKYPGAAA